MGPVTKLKSVGRTVDALEQIKHVHESAELEIHERNLRSCTINTLSVSRKLPRLELSRQCLMVSDVQGKKLQFVILDFMFKLNVNLKFLVRFLS